MPPSPHSAWSPASLEGGTVTALAAGPALALVATHDGAGGHVARSADGGATWAAANTGLPEGAFVEAVLVRGTSALAGTAGEGLYASADGGATWALVGRGLPEGASVSAFAHARGALFAGTRAHGVYRSDDGGRAWAAASDGLPWGGRGLEVLALAAAAGGVVVAHPLGLHRLGLPRPRLPGAAGAARAWQPLSLGLHRGTPLHLLAVPGGALVAGVGGALLRSGDGGTTWAEALGAPPAAWPVGAVGRTLYAADVGTLARSDDGGRAWAPFGEGLPSSAIAERLAGAGRTLLVGTLDHGLWRRPRPVAGARTAEPADTPALEGNDPNPFHDRTAVAFRLPRRAGVVLTVEDGAGREIARLDEGVRAAGLHRAPFEAAHLPVGFYTARLDAEGQRWTRLMVRL